MARRKNATFTLDKTYGAGHGDRTLLKAFYRKLNEHFPGATPVPIPPESQIHPQHDAKKQALIVADYAVRKIAPIALFAAGSVGRTRFGRELAKLTPLTEKRVDTILGVISKDSASTMYEDEDGYVNSAVEHAYNAVRSSAGGPFSPVVVGGEAAAAAANAAELDNAATWAAVNEMLAAL